MKVLREVAAGSLAAGTTATIFNPLELVKTRLQVQADPTAKLAAVYRKGFVDALVQIARADGLSALWRYGVVGFVGRDLFYSGIRIGTYPTIRKFYAGEGVAKDDVGLLTKILAGATTGCGGAALANPMDIARVRMSVEGGVLRRGVYVTGMKIGQQPLYYSTWDCLRTTFSKEGLKGLYKGVEATSARAAMLSAGQLSSYDHSKTVLRRHGWMEEGDALHVVAALISGVVACLCCHPADCVKSRLMVSPHACSAAHFDAWVVVRDIYVTDGLRGFFRGFWPAYARAGPSFFIQMPIVEGLRSFFGLEAM